MLTSAGYNSLTARALRRHLFNKKKLSLETRTENWDFEIMISSGDSATTAISGRLPAGNLMILH